MNKSKNKLSFVPHEYAEAIKRLPVNPPKFLEEYRIAFLQYWKDGNMDSICAIVQHTPKDGRKAGKYLRSVKAELKQLNDEVKHINHLLELAAKPFNGYSAR